MSPREQRGLELAQKVNIRLVGKGVEGQWVVPSASGSNKYTVDLNSNAKRCTCPDYELRRCKCKHIYAVEFTVRKQTETKTDDSGQTVVTETVTATKRVTYRQNWPAYNAAQTGEKATFQTLLHDLCNGVPDLPREAQQRAGTACPLARCSLAPPSRCIPPFRRAASSAI